MKDIKDSRTPIILKHSKKYTFRYVILKLKKIYIYKDRTLKLARRKIDYLKRGKSLANFLTVVKKGDDRHVLCAERNIT